MDASRSHVWSIDSRAARSVVRSVAAYKYPRIIEFADVLPMTATGKILKRALS